MSERVCAPGVGRNRGRGYCGRKNKTTTNPAEVTCVDCGAAMRADEEANRRTT